ncbi:SDR family NAD(P)-dependent oxidoreductase [Aquabacter cavernae]|uniref:SDR family NAD(P)-dependent oxidoreductase n=1 Tax=Aquabacter cavernae TaxID=2496029 RepID=UPI000F8F2EB5|nr:SDR family oxidoreductase [Aquabacter cavernae]
MASAAQGRLSGKSALITGGASGIGLAIARAFANEGARIILFDRDRAAAEAAAATLPDARALEGSVTVRADLVRAYDDVIATEGSLDIVLANAGVSQNQPTLDVTDADWQRVMDVNCTGVFLTAQEAGRRMTAQGSGVILMMASLYGLLAAPERLGYCVSKAGVVMMAKALAVEWAASGVRVNALAPGYVETPFLSDLIARGRLDPARLKARTPIGRLITPEEVARAAVFLAEDGSAAITGHVLGIDGGWTAYGYV